MSQERPRKIPVISWGHRSSNPVACTAPVVPLSPETNAGRARSPVLAHSKRVYVSFARRDVRHVHEYFLGAVHVEYLAAGALPESMRRHARSIAGRLKPLASIPQRIFSGGPISLIAPCLKIGLGAVRQEHQPRAPEISTGLLEGRGGVGLMFTRMRSRIETAAPFPLIGVMRIAAADRDRADMHIPVVDVPAFLSVVCGSAAGEFWHAALKRGTWRKANRPRCWLGMNASPSRVYDKIG
jgi:hypothetical protein